MIGRIGNNSNQMWLFNRLNQLGREQTSINQQISSGRRDGPASFFITANWLRFDISGMQMAQDNVNDGLSMIAVTQANSQATMDLLQEAHEIAVRGANETLSTDQQEKLRQDIYEKLTAADETIQRAEFNGKSLYTGEKVNIQIGPKIKDMYYVNLPKFDLGKYGLSPDRPDEPHKPKPHPRPHPVPHPKPPAPKPRPPKPGPPDKPDHPKPKPPHGHPSPKPKPHGGQNVGDINLDWAFNPLPVWNSRPLPQWTEKGPDGKPRFVEMPEPVVQDDSTNAYAAAGSSATASNAQSSASSNAVNHTGSVQYPGPGKHRPASIPAGRTYTNPPPTPPEQPSFKEIIHRLKGALESVKHSMIRLEGQSSFLNTRLDILGSLMANTESMRSRFEDANFVELQRQSNSNDIYRQAAMQSIAQQQSDQRALVAMFLGLT